MADRRTKDPGFTLVEVIVVVSILGLVATVIGAVFVVIARTSPVTEDRTDDSRSLLGLTNWLSQDVTSTSETGFTFGDTGPSVCTGVPTSTRLVLLEWSQRGVDYAADYRYVAAGPTSGRLHRYGCRNGGDAQRSVLTSELRNGPGDSDVPIDVIERPNGTGGHEGLEMVVRVYDDDGTQRELLRLDATTENVITTLPPDPTGPSVGNLPPEALGSVVEVTVPQGSTLDYTLPAFDPNGDALTATVTGTPPTDPDIDITGLTATITTTPTTPLDRYTFTYEVSDGTSTDTGTIAIRVTAPMVSGSNEPPVIDSAVAYASAGQAATFLVPAADADGVTTPPGDPSSLTIPTLPAGWSYTVGAYDTDTDTFEVTVTPSTSATGYTTVGYTVADSTGVASTSTLVVAVCEASFFSVAPSTVRIDNTGNLLDPFDVSIIRNNACSPLVMQFEPTIGSVKQEAFLANTTVTISEADYDWTVPDTTRLVPLTLRLGANGPTLDTASLTTTKAP